MPLSDIVNVQITRQTQSVSEQGFGTLMILGTFKNFNDLIRSYSNMQEVATDFNPIDDVYIAAQDYFSQPITPELLYIGRRTVDTVGIDVETAMPNQNYTVTINGNDVTVNSTTSVMESVVSMSGIVTNILNFSADFVTSNSIIATVNGTPLSAVPFNTDNSTTLSDLATAIGLASGVSSSTATGAHQITVVFTSAVNAQVNSVVTTGGASQPTVTIVPSGPLVTGNLINVSVNGTIVGTVTSKITYSTNFTAGTSTVTTVNGVAGSAVLFNTDNATTLSDIATEIALSSGVASATSDGSHTITVVFTSAGNNTVNSSITTGGSTPTATISEGGFSFATSSASTMSTIATAIQSFLNTGYSPGIATAVVSGVNSNIISINGNPNQAGVVNFFTVTLGASQATAGIVNSLQPTTADTIADALATAINGFTPTLPVHATTPSTPDGTLSMTATVAGTPYTVAVSTNIANPIQARVTITQEIPTQAYTV